ncbi:hypothetical protein CKR_1571 [Clostridium kluyveri NBRC 12016]|nr:hypothetical protein CKR_1571 [Clostridium kluyveri NBRC 12016]
MSMKEYVIKEVSLNELEECAEVIRQGFGTVAKDFGLTIENCATNGAFIKMSRLVSDKNRGNFMYSINVDDKIVGFMQLEKKSEEKYELEKITVLPEYRRYGYGEKLLVFAKIKVKRLNGKIISIGIIEENTILKQWYQKNGFIHKGTKKFDFLPFTVGFMEMIIE